MSKVHRLANLIGNAIKQHPWLLLIILCVAGLNFGFVEAYTVQRYFTEMELIGELIFDGMILPLSLAGLVFLLSKVEQERTHAIDQLSFLQELETQLNNAGDWQALAAMVVRFPHNLLPLAGSHLFLSNPQTGRFDLAASWGFEDPELKSRLMRQITPPEAVFALAQKPAPETARPENGVIAPGQAREGLNCFCIPLSCNQTPVGVLYLYTPEYIKLTPELQRSLGAMAAMLARPLHEAQAKLHAGQQNEAVESERRRIARDLHDTLAQDLAYLNQQLDQLGNYGSAGGPQLSIQELQRMQAVSHEAYRVVRDTLLRLQPAEDKDLAAALQAYGKMVGERAGFRVEFTFLGLPPALPAEQQAQVFNIFREILANVERHAGAHLVYVRLICAEDGLQLRVQDDGRGFDPEQAPEPGHFGLKFIAERTRQLGGNMILRSASNIGTLISITVPLAPDPAPAGPEPVASQHIASALKL